MFRLEKLIFVLKKIYFIRYVIKATTYEIGVLADVPDSDNATEDGPIVKQQVDLSFYNTESNGSHINFGDVPLPVQTNVSGQIITGKTNLLNNSPFF
jgi:hypothetical protein